MKKFLLILVVILASCANPVVDVEEPVIEVPEVTNPFVGTWKNMTAASFGSNVGFTFRDDGTFDYWHSAKSAFGTGNYSYTDTQLILNNCTGTWDEGKLVIPNKRHQYEWSTENQFWFYQNREDSDVWYTDGRYVRQ